MERLEARGRAIAEAAAARALAGLTEAARGVPGVEAEAGDGRVVITGRGLWRLPGLRWIGGYLR